MFNPPFALVNARLVDPASGYDGHGGVLIEAGRIRAAGPDVAGPNLAADLRKRDLDGAVLAPGLIDMRVFVGERGFTHPDSLKALSEAAATGGVTAILLMPDGPPILDDPALVTFGTTLAKETASVKIRSAAALTRGLDGREMAEIGLMRAAGALAFSQGRRPLADSALMRRIFIYSRDFDALVDHVPQDPGLAAGGVAHEGESATRLGLAGVPAAAETIMLERDVRLAEAAGARYHAALISSAESVPILKRAKSRSGRISAAASINHLSFNENDLGLYDSAFKTSPPLRAEDDRRTLIEALRDGTIDVLVSAHDPQDFDAKHRPFPEAADGAAGLETLLSAGLRLVHDESLSLLRLITAASLAPADLLGLEEGRLTPGSPADLVVFDIDRPWIYDSPRLPTPFAGARFTGRVLCTYVSGRIVYDHASR